MNVEGDHGKLINYSIINLGLEVPNIYFLIFKKIF